MVLVVNGRTTYKDFIGHGNMLLLSKIYDTLIFSDLFSYCICKGKEVLHTTR